MNSLDELLRALVIVIVHYHQSTQSSRQASISIEWTDVNEASITEPVPPSALMKLETHDPEIALAETKQIDDLLEKTHQELLTALLIYVNEATLRCETRRTLLLYLVDTVILLKSNDDPEIECAEFDTMLQTRLVDFINNLRMLCNTKRYQSLSVFYDNQTVLLNGLLYANSKLAMLLQTMVLQPLSIAPTTELWAIRCQIECLFLRYKTSLMSQIKQNNHQLFNDKLMLKQEIRNLLEQVATLSTQILTLTELTQERREVPLSVAIVVHKPILSRKLSLFGKHFSTVPNLGFNDSELKVSTNSLSGPA